MDMYMDMTLDMYMDSPEEGWRSQTQPGSSQEPSRDLEIEYITFRMPPGRLLGSSWGPLWVLFGSSWGPRGPREGPKRTPRGGQEASGRRSKKGPSFGALKEANTLNFGPPFRDPKS